MYALLARPHRPTVCTARVRESLVYSVTLTHTRFLKFGASEDYTSEDYHT